jgi:GGDEF domain-containing protein
VAARFRSAVQQMSLGAKSTGAVEVSIGLAAWRPGQDWQTVYQAADSDLYEDKRSRKTMPRPPNEERPVIRLLGRTGRRKAAGT